MTKIDSYRAKRGGRSRLYLHIYFAILGIIVLVVALTIAIAKVLKMA